MRLPNGPVASETLTQYSIEYKYASGTKTITWGQWKSRRTAEKNKRTYIDTSSFYEDAKIVKRTVEYRISDWEAVK